jgi:WD40 repeat protein
MYLRITPLLVLCVVLATSDSALGHVAGATDGEPQRKDVDGDPLPPGAVARFGTLRWRTGSPCVALAYAPDGKTLFSAGANGCSAWDVATGKKLRQFGPTYPNDRLTAAAFSTDARLVAIGYWHNLGVWDTQTGKPLWKVKLSNADRGPATLASVAFAADGAKVAWRHWTFTDVEMRDAKTGEMLERLPGPRNSLGENFFHAAFKQTSDISRIIDPNVHSLTFSPDGMLAAANDEDGAYCVWNLKTRKPQPASLERGRSLKWLTFSPDNQHISWLEDGVLFLMDRKTWTPKVMGTVADAPLVKYESLSFSSDGTRIACVDEEDGLHCWDIASGKRIVAPQGKAMGQGASYEHVLAWAPDGKTLVVAQGVTLQLYDAATGIKRTAPQGHTSLPSGAAFSPDGQTLASNADDGTLCLWDKATGKLRRQATLPPGDYGATPLFTPDGKSLVATDGQGQICWFDAASLAKQRTWVGPAVSSMPTFGSSADSCAALVAQLGPTSLAAPLGGVLDLVEDVTPEWTREILQLSADGKVLLTVQASDLAWWDVATGRQQRRFPLYGRLDSYDIDLVSEESRYLSESGKPRNRTLALMRTGRNRPLWQIKTGQRLASFDRLGKSLVLRSGPWSEGVKDTAILFHLVEAHTGKVRRIFRDAPGGAAGEIESSPDGRTLASSAKDGQVQLWDVFTEVGRLAAP